MNLKFCMFILFVFFASFSLNAQDSDGHLHDDLCSHDFEAQHADHGIYASEQEQVLNEDGSIYILGRSVSRASTKPPGCTCTTSSHYTCWKGGCGGGHIPCGKCGGCSAGHKDPCCQGHAFGSWSSWFHYGNNSQHKSEMRCRRCPEKKVRYASHNMGWSGTTNNCGACSYVDSSNSHIADEAVNDAKDSASKADDASDKAGESSSESSAAESESHDGDNDWISAESSDDSGDANVVDAVDANNDAKHVKSDLDEIISEIENTQEENINETEEENKHKICPICGKELIEGNPVSIITGAKIENFNDLSIGSFHKNLEIQRQYNSQDHISQSLGQGWIFNYDSRIILGAKPRAEEAYNRAKASTKEAKEALLRAQLSINKALTAYSRAILSYEAAARHYGNAHFSINQAILLLLEAESLLAEARTILSQISMPKDAGSCSALQQALSSARSAINQAEGACRSSRSNYRIALSTINSARGTRSSALMKASGVKRKRDTFKNITAPQILGNINSIINYLELKTEELRQQYLVSQNQISRNKYVSDFEYPEQALVGNENILWVDEMGVLVVLKSSKAPKWNSDSILSDGEMNVWPEGTTFKALYGNDWEASTSPKGNFKIWNTKTGRNYLYNSYGRLTSLSDRQGNEISIQFEGRHIEKVSDNYERWIKFETNFRGQITKAFDFSGREISYAYKNRLLTSFVDSVGDETTYSYDDRRQLAEIRDPLGNYRTYVYENGKVVLETDQIGNSQSFIYGDNSVEHINRRGFSKTYLLDENRHITEVSDRDSCKTYQEFNGSGHQISVTAPDQSRTSFEVDDRGRKTLINLPTGGQIAYEYHVQYGEITKEIIYKESKIYSTKTFEYFESGNKTGLIKKIIFPNSITGIADGSVYISYDYDFMGRITELRDVEGIITKYIYTDKYPYDNSYVQIQKTGGPIAKITFDKLGNTSHYELGKQRVSMSYDSMGRITQKIEGGSLDKIIDYTYDSHGLSVVGGPYYENDINNIFQELIRNKRGEVEKVILSEGIEKSITEYKYNSEGMVESEILADGRKLYNEYDPVGRLTNTGYLDNYNRIDLANYIYDDAGRISLVEQDSMIQKEYQYPSVRETKVVSFGGELVEKSKRDSLGRLTSSFRLTNKGEASVRYEYDRTGRRIAMIRLEDGVEISREKYLYNIGGKIASYTNSLGAQTSFEYNNLGQLATIIRADGGKEIYTYTNEGQIETITSPLGGITRFEYNSFGETINIIYPLGSNESREYDALGRPITSTDRNGFDTSIIYGDLNKYIKIVNALGDEKYTEFDKGGRVIKSMSPGGSVSISKYSQVTGQIQNFLGPEGENTSYNWDSYGFLLSISQIGQNNETGEIDERRTQFFRDPYGRLTNKREADGRQYFYQYDSLGNINSLERLGKDSVSTIKEMQRKWEYNLWGQLKEEQYKKEGETFSKTFQYDTEGNVISSKNFRGESSRFTYDNLNRLIEKRYSDMSTDKFSYDLEGRLIGSRTSLGYEERYNYNLEGDLLRQETLTNGNMLEELLYQWNKEGQLLQINGEDDYQVSYSYDKLGRVSKASGSEKYDYQYNKDNSLVKIFYGDSKWVDNQYDKSGRLTGTRTVQKSGNRNVISDGFLYYYDDFGNITEELDYMGFLTSYSYDIANRLTRTSYPAASGISRTKIKERLSLGLSVPHFEEDDWEDLWDDDEDDDDDEDNDDEDDDEDDEQKFPWEQKISISKILSESLLQKNMKSFFGTGNSGIKSHPITNGAFFSEEFEYDSYGRLGSKSSELGQIIYRYNESDQLLSVGNKKFNYDSDGNRTTEYFGEIPQDQKDFNISISHNSDLFIEGDWDEKEIEELNFDFVSARNPQTGDSVRYKYRSDNRMTAMSDSNGNGFDYSYDGLNRRISKEHKSGPLNFDDDDSVSFPLPVEYTTYMGTSFQTIFEDELYSGDDDDWDNGALKVTRRHTLGPGGRSYGSYGGSFLNGDDDFDIFSDDDDESDYDDLDDMNLRKTIFYMYDVRGSVSSITPSTKGFNRINRRYDAFGSPMRPLQIEMDWDDDDFGDDDDDDDDFEGDSFNPFAEMDDFEFEDDDSNYSNILKIGFTGQRNDRETDNLHFMFREYDPLSASFTTEDPVKDGALWYAYCGNNPIGYVDPLGLVIVQVVEGFQQDKNDNKEDLLGGSTEYKIKQKGCIFTSVVNALNSMVTYANQKERERYEKDSSVFIFGFLAKKAKVREPAANLGEMNLPEFFREGTASLPPRDTKEDSSGSGMVGMFQSKDLKVGYFTYDSFMDPATEKTDEDKINDVYDKIIQFEDSDNAYAVFGRFESLNTLGGDHFVNINGIKEGSIDYADDGTTIVDFEFEVFETYNGYEVIGRTYKASDMEVMFALEYCHK